MSPFTTDRNGDRTWTSQAGDVFHVTGRDVRGRRFKRITTASWMHACGINLYDGSRWLVRDGKRYLINRVGGAA